MRRGDDAITDHRIFRRRCICVRRSSGRHRDNKGRPIHWNANQRRMGNLPWVRAAIYVSNRAAWVRLDIDCDLRNRNRVVGDNHLVSLSTALARMTYRINPQD